MQKKRLLIYTNNFLPGYRAGGPVTSIANLSKLLKKDFKITIITSNKDFGMDKPYCNIKYDEEVEYEGFNVIYLSAINLKKVLYTIKICKPELIYLNSFFSSFTQLVLFGTITNKLNCPIVLAPRGELQTNALAIKGLKKKIYLIICKLINFYNKVHFHATDKIEFDCINNMISTDNISILPNVPKISDGTPLSKEKNELKLIFISRISIKKNLLFALDSLSSCEFNVTFDIYGPIEDAAYWKKCQLAIEALPKNIITEYKGIVTPTNISSVMRKYHALLLPTKTENYGHVIVEAMQSGVVPIISDQTPWVELSKHKAGWDLNLEKIEDFTKIINILYKMGSAEYSNLSRNTIEYINERLDIDELKQNYIDFFNKVLIVK